MRYITLLAAVICWTGLTEVEGALSACSTPGFYLSYDNEWCFAYSNVYKTAPHHSVMCKSYGATLLTIESTDKQALVSDFLTYSSKISSQTLWFGLTNIIGDTDWALYGINGTLAYTNWASNYPVSTSKYNCGAFLAGNGGSFEWSNYNCLTTKQAVCQRSATSDDTN